MDLLNNNIRSKCLTPKTALRSVSIQVQLNQELKTHMNTIANINPDTAQSVFSVFPQGRESRIPQIVITATQICFAASALLNC